MANQPSPTVEEIQLRKRARRRLVGAITLVALMVTVLPMILDDEPKPVGQDIAIDIPSQEIPHGAAPAAPPAATVAQAPAPRSEAPAAPEAKPAEPAPPAAKPQAAKKIEKPAEKPVEKAAEPAAKPKEAKPAAAKASEAPHPAAGFIILLGSFQSESNAAQRQAKLKEAGVKFYVEKLPSPAGEKIAVRAGPYPDRQDAERVLAKLKAAGIADGMVKEK